MTELIALLTAAMALIEKASGTQSSEWRDEAAKLADKWRAQLAANDAEADAALKAKFPEGSER